MKTCQNWSFGVNKSIKLDISTSYTYLLWVFFRILNSFLTTEKATNSANFWEWNKRASELLACVQVSTNFAFQFPGKNVFLYTQQTFELLFLFNNFQKKVPNNSLWRSSPLSALHNVGRSGKFETNLVGLKWIWLSNLIRKVIWGSAPMQPKRSHQVRIYRPTNNHKLVRLWPKTWGTWAIWRNQRMKKLSLQRF